MQSIEKKQQGQKFHSLPSQFTLLTAYGNYFVHVVKILALTHFSPMLFWNSRKKISGNGRRGTELRKLTRKPPAFAKLPPVEVTLIIIV